jgi:hypothetical protein
MNKSEVRSTTAWTVELRAFIATTIGDETQMARASQEQEAAGTFIR